MRSAVHGLQRRITRSKFAADLVRLEASHGEQFDAVHMSTFWQRMGRIARTHPPTGTWACANAEALAPSRARTLQMLPAMEPRAVVGTAYGIASLRVESATPWDEVWAQVADSLLGSIDALNMQDVSNTAWALSRAKYGAGPLYDALAARLEAAAAAGDDGPLMPQAIANSLWAFSAAGVSAPRAALVAFWGGSARCLSAQGRVPSSSREKLCRAGSCATVTSCSWFFSCSCSCNGGGAQRRAVGRGG